jgi:ABC-type proline/glycine betaine transport system permease subunit
MNPMLTRYTFIAALALVLCVAKLKAEDRVDTIKLDWAYYNPLSLVLKDKGLLEQEFKQDGVKVEWTQSLGSNKALGIGESSKIALIALGVFFPVYLNLMNAVQSVDRKLVEVGLANGFRGFALVKKIVLPASLPAYLVGLRQGLSLGWMFVVAAEIMGASRGLGYLLIDGQTTGRPAIMIASVILFAICGKLSDGLLATLSERWLYWQDVYKT